MQPLKVLFLSAEVAPFAKAGGLQMSMDRVVPAVRRLFAELFGNERLMSGDQFESIAYGLALIGHSPDPDRWTAAGGLKSREGA